ncbi:hypothetical protein HU200_031040 [Digitaria exilis]|uniref:Protein BZR1 homolog n=1 Tax=Digitaria exilis TaxID=1010633 RepID=A0A835BPW0_9POAL|nr:hypothetical protein HU200_031040 [Digitaria exilis]
MEVIGAGREEGEAAAAVEMDAAAPVVAGRRGCIRSTQGPWTVRRRGRGGGMTTSLRHPTPRERENNRQRERRRRQVAARIYSGLRAHAGYTLPKHADQNDVLRALCAEAGYLVDDEGNVTRLQVLIHHDRVSLIMHPSRFSTNGTQLNVPASAADLHVFVIRIVQGVVDGVAGPSCSSDHQKPSSHSGTTEAVTLQQPDHQQQQQREEEEEKLSLELSLSLAYM